MSDTTDYPKWLRHIAEVSENVGNVQACPKALRRAADALELCRTESEARREDVIEGRKRIEQLTVALKNLIYVKDWKNTHGKDETYLAIQPAAWDRARKVTQSAGDCAPKDTPVAECYDCGLEYGTPGFADLVVPNEVWNTISPTGDEGGLLCPTCLIRALENHGFSEVPATFRSGPAAMTETVGDSGQ